MLNSENPKLKVGSGRFQSVPETIDVTVQNAQCKCIQCKVYKHQDLKKVVFVQYPILKGPCCHNSMVMFNPLFLTNLLFTSFSSPVDMTVKMYTQAVFLLQGVEKQQTGVLLTSSGHKDANQPQPISYENVCPCLNFKNKITLQQFFLSEITLKLIFQFSN